MQPIREHVACWRRVPSDTGKRLLFRAGSVRWQGRECRLVRLGVHGLCSRGQTVGQTRSQAHGVVIKTDGQTACETVESM